MKPGIKTITVRRLINFVLIPAAIVRMITGFDFRALSKGAVRNQARAHAELVQSRLTAQIKAGIMDKRDYYLQEIRLLHEIDHLYVIRGQAVDAQLGPGAKAAHKVDEVARRALGTRRQVFMLDEFTSHRTIRAIIPYIAASESTLNCLGCHQVPEGAVLGAVDIDLKVTQYQHRSLLVLGGMALLFATFVVLIPLNTSSTIQRHVKDPLESLIVKAKKA